jgi:predicted Zn-dependent protease
MGAERVAALALLGLAACYVPTVPGEAPGYDPALASGELYRWTLGRTVAVYVDPTAQPAGTDLRAATASALDAWRDALHYRELSLTLADDPRTADVVLHVAAAPRVVGTAGCTPPAGEPAGATFFCRARLTAQQDTALTLPLLAGGGGRVKVDVLVDPAQTPSAGGLPALVAHELGHALGIGAHSPDASDLMYAAPAAARPSARDAATLRWLLHQDVDLRL